MTASNVVAFTAPVRSVEVARRRADRIRAAFQTGVDELIAAWQERDYEKLGYGTGEDGWKAYLEGEYGGLRLTLPSDVRRPRLLQMRKAGMSTRVITLTPGAGSAGTVSSDLKALLAAGQLTGAEKVTAINGQEHAATRPTVIEGELAGSVRVLAPEPVRPAGGLTVVDVVVAAVATRGQEGFTVHECAEHLGWKQGATSMALSRAADERRRGGARLLASGRYRDGCTVYIAAD